MTASHKPPPDRDAVALELLHRIEVIGDMIIPGDRPLVGRRELVAEAELLGLGQSATYAAVAKLEQQPFMAEIDGIEVTMTSSGGLWLAFGRHEQTQERRVEAGRATGSLPPKPGSRARGRPTEGSER